MKNKIILIGSLLLASGSALAETDLLEKAAKQTAKAAAPGAAKTVESANQALENAKSVGNVPEAAKKQAEEAVKRSVDQQIEAATPKEAKQAVETVNSGREAAKNLKDKVDAVPKSTKALKQKAKQKAAEKALDLLR